MKRNKLMRIATAMLVVTLLSTSVISGTFAKYVTTDFAQDAARVAKFGVLASAQGILFGDSYAKGANTIQAANTANEESVTAFNTGTANGVTNGMGQKVVAPGTKNEDGMTLSVVGKPEVSTRLILDAPEAAADKDYVNTDIFLKTLGTDYFIMQKVNLDQVVITLDNCNQFYKLDTSANTFSTLQTLPSTGDSIYKCIDVSDIKGANYYPIAWTVENTAGNKTSCANVGEVLGAVQSAFGVTLNSTTNHYQVEHAPNYSWTESAKITWEWAFTDVAAPGTWNDVTGGANWENISLQDKKDTILGDMIAKCALDQDNSPGADYYEIAVQSGESAKTRVLFDEVDAATNSANKVWIAYTGTAPQTLAAGITAGNVYACLTVSFGARITVEQVD